MEVHRCGPQLELCRTAGQSSHLANQERGVYRSRHGGRNWERILFVSDQDGGESGHVVAHPDKPDIVFGGSYGGYLVRLDHDTGDRRIINAWPDNPMSWGAAELKYRFN